METDQYQQELVSSRRFNLRVGLAGTLVLAVASTVVFFGLLAMALGLLYPDPSWLDFLIGHPLDEITIPAATAAWALLPGLLWRSVFGFYSDLASLKATPSVARGH